MRQLSDWIAAYLQYTQHSEAPDAFHRWTAVSTIAGALRRRVYIDMGYFTWTPNFFTIFVAPPGVVSKSTTANIGMDLLRELPYIHFGPASASWQALVGSLGASREDFPKGDGTFEPMCAVTYVISELGTFLDPDNREMIDVLVSLWGGDKRDDTWERLTKKEGLQSVVNPWINLIGCTTPTWMADNFSRHFAEGGFASRTVFVYSAEKRQLVAYPKDHLPSDFRRSRDLLVGDLKEISNLRGEYQLSSKAKAWGEAWYEEHHLSDNHEHLASERFKGYLSRKQTHLHKVAMCRAASLRDELVIEQSDLEWAEAALTELEVDLPKVYGELTLNQKMQLTGEVSAVLATAPSYSMKKKELYRNFLHSVSIVEFEEVLNSMIAADVVALYNHSGDIVVELLEFGLGRKKQ